MDEGRLVRVFDCEGNTLTGIIEIDGEIYPGDRGCYDNIVNADQFQAREDDIWICGYPKSGAHWTWDIVHMILAGKGEHITTHKDESFFEICCHEELDKQSSPRVINTHLPVHRMPKEVFKKQTKMIYLMRNPKDVAVSYFHHVKASKEIYQYEGSWNGYCNLFVEGKGEYCSWFQNVKGWWNEAKRNDNILCVKYEDMLQNLPSEVKRIANFLDKEAQTPETLCTDIAHMCTFDVMKKRKLDNNNKTSEDWYDSNQHIFYRKGKVGDWKNWFTEDQNKTFDEVYDKEMAQCAELSFQFVL